MFDFNFKFPKDRNSLIFFSTSGIALLLLLISLIYYMAAGSGNSAAPIKPINPLTSTTSKTSSSNTGQAVTTDQSAPASTTTNSTKQTASTSKPETATKPSSKPEGVKNIIIEASLSGTETSNGESINTFTVNKAIDEKGLVTIITEVAVARLNEASMESVGHKGNQGLIDISLQLENKGSEPVSIKPEANKFTVNGKDYPLANTATLKNITIEKGQKVENNDLTFVMPELENADAVKEISFTWQTTTGKTTQDYSVLLVLKKS